jgi:hypothetical protein
MEEIYHFYIFEVKIVYIHGEFQQMLIFKVYWSTKPYADSIV